MSFLDKIRNPPTPALERAIDPVCGMSVDPARAAGTSRHADETVHFCSAGCKRRFDADPALYAGRAGIGRRS